MSHDPRHHDDKPEDRLDLHHRQQLSALVDGELAPDEARFLLRRMEHDGELSGRFERWQLCGDVLRGQVSRAAAPDLSLRIAEAVAAAGPLAAGVQAPSAPQRRRAAWTRWGGGAALAASVAAVAMFVGRPAATDPSFAPAATVAVQTLPSTEAVLAAGAPTTAPSARPAAAAAQAPLRAVARAAARAPARAAVSRATTIADAVADAGAQVQALSSTDPFASAAPLQARPWPRAALAQPSAGYTASFGQAAAATGSFYPFEPSLPAQAAPPETGDLPAPPEQQD